MAKKLVKLVTVVNGDVLEEVVEIGCIVAYPQRLNWGMMDVKRYFPEDNALEVFPERGVGTPQKISADHVILLHHPEAPIPREFELLFDGGDFPAKIKSLYLDVIKEKEPSVYEQLGVPGELRDTVVETTKEDEQVNTKKCECCGAEFESKAHNAKYCPDHRSKKARDAYVAAQPETPAEVITTPVDLSQVPVEEPETPKFVTVEKGDTLKYKGKLPMVVLDIINNGSELYLLNLQTGGKGVLSAAIENWEKAQLQEVVGKAHQPVDVTSAIEIIGWGGVPSRYQGKGITVASVKVRKNRKEYIFMINNSKDHPGTLYVRHQGTLNEVEEKEILAAYSARR